MTVEPKDEYYEKPGADAHTWQIHETHRDRWRHPCVLEAANLTSTFDPNLYPNPPQHRPTQADSLDEDPPEISIAQGLLRHDPAPGYPLASLEQNPAYGTAQADRQRVFVDRWR